MSGGIGKLESSSVERSTDGQTTSPVLELTNCVPRIPGMIITGRFPVFSRAEAKMRSRFGVCFGAMQPERSRAEPIQTNSTSKPPRRESLLDCGFGGAMICKINPRNLHLRMESFKNPLGLAIFY